jgi:hypothetical protein
MISKLVGIATLFAAGSILVAGNPTLGAKGLGTQASSSTDLRCGGGGRRCGGGGRRCGGGGRRCGGGGGRHCASQSCAARTCGNLKK